MNRHALTEENPSPRNCPPSRPHTDTGPHHIVATASLADERTRVLKHADTFVVFDHYGDIESAGLGEEGLYHEGTRYLSRWVLDYEGSRPFFLSSTVREENDLLTVALTNPDVLRDGKVWALLGTLHIALKKFLWRGVLYQEMRVKNHGLDRIEASINLHFAADFADIFEIRGMQRTARGADLGPEVTADRVVLGYQGLDGIVRYTVVQFSPAPSRLTAANAPVESIARTSSGDHDLHDGRLQARGSCSDTATIQRRAA